MKTDGKTLLPSRFRRTAIVIFAFLLVGIAADFFLIRLLSREFRTDQEMFVTLEAGAIRARIEDRVNSNLFLAYGMAANISVQPDLPQERFDALARVLINKSTSLKNIAAAPNFVIRYIFPLEGNQKAIGLNYRTAPEQWEQAHAAMQTRRMILAGPINLVQGGRGLVARVPVCVNGGAEFWGLVSAVMDLDTMISQVGIDTDGSRIKLAIRGKDSKGAYGDIFWGDHALFDPSSQAITMPVSLPSGSWQLAAIPRNGWVSGSPYEWLVHCFVLLIIAIGCAGRIQSDRSRQSLEENEQRMRAMSQASHDALAMIDTEDRITFWNPAAEAMFGFTEAEVLGRKLHDIIVLPRDMEHAKAGLARFARTGTGPILGRTMEMTALRKSGETFPVERAVSAFQLRGKWFAVGSMRDISARKEYEKRLNELATTDELTGLANRRFFMDQAETQLKRALRYKHEFCFMMFDLDHFKRINDTYGHAAGDVVLRTVAGTLSSVMRATDIYGRVGGEEFAVVMPETTIADARIVAERLRQQIAELRIETHGSVVWITASIGIAHLQPSATELSALMKNADTALYEAKHAGRNRVIADDGQ